MISTFQQGDKNSYQLIFKLLYPSMCLFAKKYVFDVNEAEDITQELFIELWNQRAKFESLEQIKAFLYLSIKNRCLNFIKHQAVKEKFAQSAQFEENDHFEEYVIETDVIQQLSNAINELPEQRKLIMQYSMEGLGNAEIAEKMQISINTVKLHKKIAYKELKSKIGNAPILSLFF